MCQVNSIRAHLGLWSCAPGATAGLTPEKRFMSRPTIALLLPVPGGPWIRQTLGPLAWFLTEDAPFLTAFSCSELYS